MVNLDNKSIPLENAIQLLELACKSEYNLAIFDNQSRILWANDGYTGLVNLEVPNEDSELSFSNSLVQLADVDNSSCYLYTFNIYKNGHVAFVIIQCPERLNESEQSELSSSMDKVQGRISESDYARVCLFENAKEIQEMHYHYQPNVKTAPIDVEAEITLLLRDCVQSLGLLGAFIYSVENKRIFTEVPDENTLNDTGLSLVYRNTVIQRDLYRLCETSSSAFFIDQNLDHATSSTLDGLQGLNIMVTPLIDSDKECSGSLICVRKKNEDKFLKSELRLSEMMAEKSLKILASRYDELTGFLNLEAFRIIIESELANRKNTDEQSSFLVLKLGNLDRVYSTGGLAAGSHILTQVAAVLSKRVRSRDFAGRLGKDEFALILNNCNSENAKVIAELLLESIAQFTFEWEGAAIKLEAWIGLLELSPDFVSAENIIRAGEEATQNARESGSYKHAIFDGMRGKQQELSRLGWEHRIYKTVINKDFNLFCQPIEDAGTYSDGIQRYELLLRLKNKDDVLLVPNVFIKAAGKLGLMQYVDRWVVGEAFNLSQSVNTHHSVSLFNFTINLSADSLNSDFANYIVQLAERKGVLADSICFDLTESAALKDLKKTSRFVNLLRKRGFEIALDDFGTGIGAYSSLRNLPLDYVKLDGNLVKNIANDSISAAIVASIAKVCRSMGIKTIAESVENEIIKEHLKRTDVDFIQGYQTARPRAVTEEFQDIGGVTKTNHNR